MDFEKEYKAGDIVEIVTPAEFRARGGSCTSDCAIAQYCGSICEVVRPTIPGLKLSPIRESKNFEKQHSMPLDHYSWSYMSVKRYSGAINFEIEQDFDAVFA